MTIKCCASCTQRMVGCHATCEIYKVERAELDKVILQRRKEMEKRIVSDSVVREGMRRFSRKCKRK